MRVECDLLARLLSQGELGACPAGAGVGTLHVMDGDSVERSNLHRQVMHTDAGADAAFFKANEGGEIDNDNTDGDETSSGELPGWTWGAIGGVVVIAFIAGAFILSRGGGDGEDKDWDY